MALGAEAVFLALMVLFGLATAGVLAFVLRDMIARFAHRPGRDEAATRNAARRALRVAIVGPVVYLLGFLIVVAATVFEVGSVAGIGPLDIGLLVVVLAAVPMAAGFYVAWRDA